jgi:hypothetical protein
MHNTTPVMTEEQITQVATQVANMNATNSVPLPSVVPVATPVRVATPNQTPSAQLITN